MFKQWKRVVNNDCYGFMSKKKKNRKNKKKEKEKAFQMINFIKLKYSKKREEGGEKN